MASAPNDSEEQRFLDRIRCMTCHEIRNEMIARTGDSFLHSSMNFRKTTS